MMKKSILLVVVSLLTAAISLYPAEPVKGALYAEIRGLSGGKIRIYKGCYARRALLKNVFSKLWAPTVYFFDKHGNKIRQEKLTGEQATQRTPNVLFHFIENIQSRLTQLPKAHYAKSVWVKAPGHEGVELFDENGELIASTDLQFFGYLKVGDSIPEKAINILKPYVSNPAILHSLKITERRNGLSLF